MLLDYLGLKRLESLLNIIMARSELVQRLDSAYKMWREEEKFSTL